MHAFFIDSKPNIMKADRFESEFSSPGMPDFDSAIDEETRVSGARHVLNHI